MYTPPPASSSEVTETVGGEDDEAPSQADIEAVAPAIRETRPSAERRRFILILLKTQKAAA